MLQSILDSATEVLWGRGTIALTLLCGSYFTVYTGFLPITRLTTVLQKTIGSVFSFHSDRENGKGVSPFAAVSTALGGTMGVGNIVGVGAALQLGGAGSIFWMWVGAFFGMMTKYMEVFLAVEFRQRDPDSRALRGETYVLYLQRDFRNIGQNPCCPLLYFLRTCKLFQRQHDPNQRHRPVTLGKLFPFPHLLCGDSYPAVRLGFIRRLRPRGQNVFCPGSPDVTVLPSGMRYDSILLSSKHSGRFSSDYNTGIFHRNFRTHRNRRGIFRFDAGGNLPRYFYP